jgi:ribosomal protein S18 acetylase RimI-like enzyme
MQLEHATEGDYPEIIKLVNAAYRGTGDDSVRSWNQEIGILEGTRTDDSLLREEASAPGGHLLIHRDPQDKSILGTVLLVPAQSGSWYLGMFTVRPALQNRQLGRALLASAEDFARAQGARSIEMGVLNVRDTLIGWYERRGYTRSGKTHPFHYDDLRFGKALRGDLEFVILEKAL